MSTDVSSQIADYYAQHQTAVRDLHRSFRKTITERLIGSGCSPSDIEVGVSLSGYDTDVFIPSAKIAIDITDEWEVCTAFNNADRYAMRNKMRTLTDSGLSVLNVFRSEWNTRRDQVMNMIASKCAPAKFRIPGRKAKFVIITPETAETFIEAHHIQPLGMRQTYNYGLLHGDDLVAVMTFYTYTFSKITDISLTRFCCMEDTQIMGGADKLMQNAIRVNGWDSMISWSDNRWSVGNLYSRLGYKEQAEDSPARFFINTEGEIVQNMAATHRNDVVSRPKGQTTAERMQDLGYVSYYDAGKRVWLWKSPNYKEYQQDELSAFMG
jgi:hypothetical protein